MCCWKLMLPKSLLSRIKARAQKGFTLMEMAVVMVMIGLVAAPATGMYHQYRVEKDWDEIEQDIADITNAMGLYRAVYGRYPCPAPANAAPGDNTYGFEFSAGSCAASAPAVNAGCDVSVNGVCAYEDPASHKTVLIGSVPYKTLNLQEQESFDTFKNRYLYAVTLDQVDNTSFDMAGGGISVVEKNNMNQSLVDPPGSAHFVVVSHGKNGGGAISRGGSVGAACSTVAAPEQENCDADSVFVDGGYDQSNFDDRVSFYTSVTPSEWQISADDKDAIHLKNTDSVAIGASMSNNLGDKPETYVRAAGANSGTIYASTRFVSEELCRGGTTNLAECFEPERIAGTLHDNGTGLETETLGTGGMSCYKPSVPGSEEDFMVGVANGDLLCDDEIYIICPSNSYITDIDGNGQITCDTFPEDWCNDEAVTTSCGAPATKKQTYSGGYRYVYSGECRNFQEPQRSYGATYFETQINAMVNPTIQDIEDFIEGINDPDNDGDFNDDRVIGECGTDYEDSDTQVRNVYRCDNGAWSAYGHYERRNYGSSWGWNSADMSHNAGYADLPNNDWQHDCWCREDYRVREETCPGGAGVTGSRLIVERHPCPQTTHQWFEVYTTELFCGCSAGTTDQYLSCDNYYDLVNAGTAPGDYYDLIENGTFPGITTGLDGMVHITYAVNCDMSGNPVIERSLTAPGTTVDTSNCTCPSQSMAIDRTSCPTGTTNNWSWVDRFGTGRNETAVDSVHTEIWICPPGVVTDPKGNVLPEPGYFGDPLDYAGPSCECDSTAWQYVYVSCDTLDKKGGPLKYKQYWDCNASPPGWDTNSDNWDYVSGECHECRWQEGDGPYREDYPYGANVTPLPHVVNGLCSCNNDSTAQFCTTNTLVDGQYDVWNNCPCQEQTN